MDVFLCPAQYEGEIQVLYQVTIIPTLTLKKLSGKDLPVKPGETLDVIVNAVDNKLVCRNEEGKCERAAVDCVLCSGCVLSIVCCVC